VLHTKPSPFFLRSQHLFFFLLALGLQPVQPYLSHFPTHPPSLLHHPLRHRRQANKPLARAQRST
jgi:hypothetical protein